MVRENFRTKTLNTTMSKKSQQEAIFDAWNSSRLTVFLHVSAIMVLTMAILGGGGYYLDKMLATEPAFFVGGLIVAFPLAQFFIYKKVKSISKSKLNSIK